MKTIPQIKYNVKNKRHAKRKKKEKKTKECMLLNPRGSKQKAVHE